MTQNTVKQDTRLEAQAVTQLVVALAKHVQNSDFNSVTLSTVIHTCNPSPWEQEAGESEV